MGALRSLSKHEQSEIPKMKKTIFALVAALILTACSETTKKETLIVCTTGMVGDAVKHLMGDSIKIEVLMGPGVDPHL